MFDFVQIEPRLFAYYAAKAGDETIAEWYREGRDVYREIAGRVYKKPPTEVTDDERQQGKVWFLMSLYMAGPKKIALETGLSYDEARKFYLDFHAGLPQIKMLSNPNPAKMGRSAFDPTRLDNAAVNKYWRPGLIERVLETRDHIKTVSGRHLHPVQFEEYKMLNALIQGSAAEVMKEALIRVDAWILESGVESRMVSVIHDELILDGPESEIELLHEVVPQLMVHEEVNKVVPILIDHEVSLTSWADKMSYAEWKESIGKSRCASAAA